ncbi:hypothetical protein HMI56_003728 [Coelomomyces lativittatus]|nr:hypothetical protein HMI56_003728 [Coelomomyces lativittatus]
MTSICNLLRVYWFLLLKSTLQTVEYYNKLPSDANVDVAIILDPMIATAGTSIACANILKDWGMNETQMKFVTICCSQEGLELLQQSYPLAHIHMAVIDEHVDVHGYVVPGLGDAGDRLFNT